MESRRELRCVIAAGGTAGHVQPSLAVAEALRARGVTVTFAGSPDRVEARLVPEAGFEFDPFRISGLPRRPSPALARAMVLGGGGYVAGPMVYAAWRKRIPAAVTEADAHLGLANRLAAPFAQRIFLAYPLPGREGGKFRVVGRPVRPLPEISQAEARARFGLPPEGAALLVFGGSQGAAVLNEVALEAFAVSGPPVLHLCGERYLDALPKPSRADYR